MNRMTVKEKEQQLIEMTTKFCTERLDEDYKYLCQKLIKKLGRKKDIPFKSGKMNIWAASVIHAIGSINFLFDKSFEPFVKYDEICEYFNVKKTTVTGKSKTIRDMLNLGYFDSEFSTKRSEADTPFNNMVMVDGFIVPLDSLPEETQNVIRQARSEGKDIELFTK